VLRISLVTRKGSDEDRRLLAVREAATAAVRLPARRNALRTSGG
jgi:hypothetical protein